MSLSRKFILLLIISVCSIALMNIIAFYLLYNRFIPLYLSEKINSREEITLEYINSIIEQQTLDEVNNIFSDTELEFFELLEVGGGKISLNNDENVNIVVDFLIKSGISPRYVEQIIPESNLEKVLISLKDTSSPESQLVRRIFYGMSITNVIILFMLGILIFYVTRRTIAPIKKATNSIQKIKIGENYTPIEYIKKDEIGLLIGAINTLSRKLSLQDKIRTRLIADISHELKTPITSIQCYLEGISDGIIELTPKTLDSITNEMQRLIKLVNMILDFQKFESQDIQPQKNSYTPFTILFDIKETLELKLSESSQKIFIHGSKHIEIFLDKDLFTQLVYNICGNFIKYAGKNTILNITLLKDSIVFQDNGGGISKKELPFLFEKFYQGKKEKAGNAEDRGIGIGLSIVKKICDLHDWGITLDSDIGNGFNITIQFYDLHTNFT